MASDPRPSHYRNITIDKLHDIECFRTETNNATVTVTSVKEATKLEKASQNDPHSVASCQSVSSASEAMRHGFHDADRLGGQVGAFHGQEMGEDTG
jgi:hypothetical protein